MQFLLYSIKTYSYIEMAQCIINICRRFSNYISLFIYSNYIIKRFILTKYKIKICLINSINFY